MKTNYLRNIPFEFLVFLDTTNKLGFFKYKKERQRFIGIIDREEKEKKILKKIEDVITKYLERYKITKRNKKIIVKELKENFFLKNEIYTFYTTSKTKFYKPLEKFERTLKSIEKEKHYTPADIRDMINDLRLIFKKDSKENIFFNEETNRKKVFLILKGINEKKKIDFNIQKELNVYEKKYLEIIKKTYEKSISKEELKEDKKNLKDLVYIMKNISIFPSQHIEYILAKL